MNNHDKHTYYVNCLDYKYSDINNAIINYLNSNDRITNKNYILNYFSKRNGNHAYIYFNDNIIHNIINNNKINCKKYEIDKPDKYEYFKWSEQSCDIAEPYNDLLQYLSQLNYYDAKVISNIFKKHLNKLNEYQKNVVYSSKYNRFSANEIYDNYLTNKRFTSEIYDFYDNILHDISNKYYLNNNLLEVHNNYLIIEPAIPNKIDSKYHSHIIMAYKLAKEINTNIIYERLKIYSHNSQYPKIRVNRNQHLFVEFDKNSTDCAYAMLTAKDIVVNTRNKSYEINFNYSYNNKK